MNGPKSVAEDPLGATRRIWLSRPALRGWMWTTFKQSRAAHPPRRQLQGGLNASFISVLTLRPTDDILRKNFTGNQPRFDTLPSKNKDLLTDAGKHLSVLNAPRTPPLHSNPRAKLIFLPVQSIASIRRCILPFGDKNIYFLRSSASPSTAFILSMGDLHPVSRWGSFGAGTALRFLPPHRAPAINRWRMKLASLICFASICITYYKAITNESVKPHWHLSG